MQIYAGMEQRMTLAEVPEHARRVEAMGYDGLNVPDAVHDGLLAASAALQATQRLKVATSVLVCFPRSPMTVAHAAWDLQASSKGRFELGLGSQVRGNIVARFSTPWTSPAPRMREYVQSLRSIWDCWQNGTALDFRGEHYQFTKMQPFFDPGPIAHPAIPIFLGAVGPKMTGVAAQVADGIITHPVSSAPRFLREVTLPAIAKHAEQAGRAPEQVELMVAGLVCTGPTPAVVAKEREKVRELFGFLYSTPAYWRTLEVHGWGELGRHLRELGREGRWSDMVGAISDEMLDQLVPRGSYDQIGEILLDWYGGLADRITFPVPVDPGADAEAALVIERMRSETSGGRNPKTNT